MLFACVVRLQPIKMPDTTPVKQKKSISNYIEFAEKDNGNASLPVKNNAKEISRALLVDLLSACSLSLPILG